MSTVMARQWQWTVGARSAGANRVVPAVVWLSQAGNSGRAGLS